MVRSVLAGSCGWAALAAGVPLTAGASVVVPAARQLPDNGNPAGHAAQHRAPADNQLQAQLTQGGQDGRPGGVGMAEFTEGSGISLAYDVAGAGDPPMVFVHGWSCDRSYLAPQIEFFAPAHTVLAVDLRGHGQSGKPAPGPGRYDVDVLADDVLAVAAAAGLHRPVLVGHSLGALAGLSAAARPGALSALVMVDPAPITNERVKAYFRESAGTVRADHDQSWRTEFARGFFLPTDTVRRDEIIAAFPSGDPGIAAAILQAMGEFDGAGALSRATVPVLSIGSAHPPNSSADLRRACPDITIGQTVGSGHFNQLEVPDQVNAMIGKFLAVNQLSP